MTNPLDQSQAGQGVTPPAPPQPDGAATTAARNNASDKSTPTEPPVAPRASKESEQARKEPLDPLNGAKEDKNSKNPSKQATPPAHRHPRMTKLKPTKPGVNLGTRATRLSVRVQRRRNMQLPCAHTRQLN
ncbi:hypothetical protein AeMF1_019090 [Aphanomyces euteiches]|nr:hypothetical protein AeMF1_019090 [Aphanomyces euteiches]